MCDTVFIISCQQPRIPCLTHCSNHIRFLDVQKWLMGIHVLRRFDCRHWNYWQSHKTLLQWWLEQGLWPAIFTWDNWEYMMPISNKSLRIKARNPIIHTDLIVTLATSEEQSIPIFSPYSPTWVVCSVGNQVKTQVKLLDVIISKPGFYFEVISTYCESSLHDKRWITSLGLAGDVYWGWTCSYDLPSREFYFSVL